MSEHQELLRNLQRSSEKIPPFSGKNLFLPENCNGFDQLVAPGGFIVPSLRWLQVLKIEFPLQEDLASGTWESNSRFLDLSRQALEIERKILDLILNELHELPPHQRDCFELALLQAPTVQNLIRRLDALGETKKQMVPGTYLGTEECHPSIGNNLLYELDDAWYQIHEAKKPPNELEALCADWGRVQSAARTAIIASSWLALVNRPGWPVPDSFSKNVGFFLEGKMPPKDESFASWRAQIDLLSQSASSSSLRISIDARDANARGIRKLEEDLVQELRSPQSPFPLWEQYLRDSRSVSIRSLVRELFPDDSVQPLQVYFKHGVPDHIVLLEQQALDFGASVYLSNFDVRKVSILYPAKDSGMGIWDSLGRESQITALVDSPISQFLSDVIFDCSDLNEKESLFAWEQQLNMLVALEENRSWQNLDEDRVINMVFKNVSFRIGQLLRLKCVDLKKPNDWWDMQQLISDNGMSLGQRDLETLTIRWSLPVKGDAE